MGNWLKRGAEAASLAEADIQVRRTVGRTLADIARHGGAAVREPSVEFDGRERDDDRLTPAEIEACLSRLTRRDLDGIRFAQGQGRGFARHRRDALRDIEAETLPGAVLGHKNIPVGAAVCSGPGGNVPCGAAPG